MHRSINSALVGLCIAPCIARAQQFPPNLASDDYTIAEVATNPATCHAYALRRRIENYQVAWNHATCKVETAAEHQWLVDTFLSGPGEHQRILWCDSIDFNGDGLFPDTQDIDDFLSVFSGGPCSTGTVRRHRLQQRRAVPGHAGHRHIRQRDVRELDARVVERSVQPSSDRERERHAFLNVALAGNVSADEPA
jgi:hypothetical protein